MHFISVLGLDHHQRKAVDEQHDVGNDAILHPARRVDAELVDRQEVVPLWVSEVDQLDVRILLAGQFVLIDLGAVEQFLGVLVGFQETGAGQVGDLVPKFFELLVGEPRLPVFHQVDRPDALSKNISQDDLTEALSQTLGWIGRKLWPCSMTFQSSAANWLRKGFSTKSYSDMFCLLVHFHPSFSGEQVLHQTGL